jgi:hypothetical protein
MEYSIDMPWVKEAVTLLQKKEEEEPGSEEEKPKFYEWVIMARVKEVKNPTMVNGADSKW